MTISEIEQKLNLRDITIRLADNGGWHNVFMERHHNGHRYTHACTLPLEPSDFQIDDARQAFHIWWADTIRDQ